MLLFLSILFGRNLIDSREIMRATEPYRMHSMIRAWQTPIVDFGLSLCICQNPVDPHRRAPGCTPFAPCNPPKGRRYGQASTGSRTVRSRASHMITTSPIRTSAEAPSYTLES